jgi:tetratricopeptide (TPR) repeat protein
MPQIVEAYEDKDWNTILILTDSLQRNNENTHDLWLVYSEALAATEQTEKSLRILEEKLAEEPTNYYALHSMGNVYAIRGEYDKAIDNYTKAIEIRPSYARPYVYRANIYVKLNRSNEAVQSYMDAVRLFVENDFFDEVKLYAPKILALDSTKTEALSFLAYAHQSEEDYCTAAHYLTKAFVLEFENQNSRFLLTSFFAGQSWYKCGDLKNAITFLESALYNEESNIVWMTYCYLACCYNKLENMDEFNKYKTLAIEINATKTDDYINDLLSVEFVNKE